MTPTSTRLPEDPAIIFLHIPKTASTTLNQIIDRQYPAEAIHSFGGDAHAAVAACQTSPEAARDSIRLLRDPVERVISYYYFIQRTP